jgi:carboxyl-terminal processing protease
MRKSRLFVAGIVAAVLAMAYPAITIGARSGGLSRTDLALIDGVVQLVERDYVHPVGPHKLTEEALKGMLSRLDPHSDYMDEEEFKEAQADISGEFGGLGIQISEEHGVPKVISPIDGTPAARAGLQPGDLIVEIGGKSTQGMSLTEIVRVLRGTPGTDVTITIARANQKAFRVTITREIIQVATVKSKLEPNGIGYVRITEFGAETPQDLAKTLNDLKRQAGGKLRGLVLDLRNDPGGLLTSAVSVAGDFIKGGTVVTIKGRRQMDNHVYSVPAAETILPDTPMVVLINGASASASEIVAGALQDHRRAKIMGTQSFGKGSVQTIIPLAGHGALRLTTALYYTPAGRSIQGQGITPDMVVEAPKDQQIDGAFMPRESTLHGAFQNPGSLGEPEPKSSDKTSDKSSDKKAANAKAPPSAPIKIQLIGTEQDGQLKAAISYLDRETASTQGKG